MADNDKKPKPQPATASPIGATGSCWPNGEPQAIRDAEAKRNGGKK